MGSSHPCTAMGLWPRSISPPPAVASTLGCGALSSSREVHRHPISSVALSRCLSHCPPPPPLEVASHSLRCSYFLGPIGLGHFRMRGTNPQRCASFAGHDIFGVGGRWMPSPPSASNKLAPPPLEVLPSAFPPRSTRCPPWAMVLRGPESPLPLCAWRWGGTM